MLDESAKAAQEVAKATGKAIDAAHDVGRFLGRVFGAVPEDLVGILGGDWLHQKRQENIQIMAEMTEARLRARKVDCLRQVSPNVAISLLKHAADENREELLEVWARLMAAAMDPKRAGVVRQSFVEAVKQLDPLDARILAVIAGPPTGGVHNIERTSIAVEASQDQIIVSLQNLTRIGCLEQRANFSNLALSAMGRELMRVLSD